MITVAGLYRYPIKSCAGHRLDSAVLDGRGIEHDRRWMVVDGAGGLRTPRELPRMVFITPTLTNGTMTLAAPGMSDLELGITDSGPRVGVGVWSDRVEAIDHGEAAAEWLTRFLAEPLRLVRFADDADRRVERRYAIRAEDQVGFADAYPLLLANEASLADLNTRLPEPLPMRRFRPNIVVRGADAYAEDRWNRIRIGPVEIAVVKPCARCAVTTVNPDTAEKGKEPLRTLATYRRADDGAVMFCQNAIHIAPGVLRVGDEVVVDEGRK